MARERGGMAASAVTATVASPVMRIMTLLQTQHANPRLVKKFTPTASSKFSFTWMRALSKVLRQQGFASLWRGNLCYLAGIVPETIGTLVLRDRIVRKIRTDLGPKRPDAPWAARHFDALVRRGAEASVPGEGPAA